ncbi:ABC-2 type transport system ATP-binding protein [Paenibacillus sp. DS2015]|uniref:ABC transporter ATP-binding protein n=1 Tax=Paenibacillus sp. DS2015 TaxID=3373917 RepID=UPI003D1F0643
MLNIEGVTKQYNKLDTAVDNLSLRVLPGEIYGFLGPNGAGKSTTIKLITGMYPVDFGSITINNFDIKYNTIKAKQSLGYVPDTPNFFLHLKGIEYLNFLKDVYAVPQERCVNTIMTLATKFNMLHALEDFIQNYSHGMRKKIQIMGSLLHNPRVWVLDEPLNGLDPKAVFTLKELMREHAEKGNAVLFSTHMLETAEHICDKIGIINNGVKIFDGVMQEVRNAMQSEVSLEKLFMELTKNDNDTD